MSSVRLKRIQLLIDLAKTDQDKAFEIFGLSQSQLVESQQQLEALKEYLKEYIATMYNPKGSIAVSKLQTSQGFLDKFHIAMQSQKDKIIKFEARSNLTKSAWIESQAKYQAMKNLYNKIQSKENIKANKIEQKLLDDLAAQQFIQRNKQNRL